MADSNHRRTTEESQPSADQRRRCGDAEGYALSEATKEGIWELRAQGLSEREIGQLGLGENTVSFYLRALGGIRPRPRRRAERCFRPPQSARRSRAGSPADSRRVRSCGTGPLPTTIAREINRSGGRHRYRAHAADREAWMRARRPRPRKLACPELRGVYRRARRDDHSPEQIAGWLRLAYPDNEAMQVSHETHRALYVQGRGALKRELTRHLEKGPLKACPLAVLSAWARESSPTW